MPTALARKDFAETNDIPVTTQEQSYTTILDPLPPYMTDGSDDLFHLHSLQGNRTRAPARRWTDRLCCSSGD